MIYNTNLKIKGSIMEDLFTIKEAAQESKMSPGWWRQRVFHRDVRFLKVGRKVLIPKTTIDQVLTQSIVEPRKNSRYSRGN